MRGANRRARQLSISNKSTASLTNEGNSKRCNTSYDWIDLQKKAASSVDKESITSAATLVDGTPLTPQQLGLMGMEALETVVGYWEDALAAYQPRNGQNLHLTTAEEAAFMKMLENILEAAYNLQDESEHMFIHQESILNKPLKRSKGRSVGFVDLHEIDGSCMSTGSKPPLLSVSSVDQVTIILHFLSISSQRYTSVHINESKVLHKTEVTQFLAVHHSLNTIILLQKIFRNIVASFIRLLSTP